MAIEKSLEERGLVLKIQRGSTHDGDGLRTVVFLKGCPLRCWWCSTPEGQSFQIEETDEKVYGKYMTVEEVMKEVRKDSTFFFHSGGGITLSGGEILSQPDFTRNLLKTSRKEGINTAIETTFFAPWDTISSILVYVNIAFVDLKFYDSNKHKKYCSVDNELILDNLIKTNKWEYPLKLIIRVPIIPGINDSPEELCEIGKFCRKLLHLDHVQLLPYHRLGTSTYKKLGREYRLGKVMPPTSEYMQRCRALVRQYVDCVV